jgi:hypothetical protein
MTTSSSSSSSSNSRGESSRFPLEAAAVVA